MGYFFDVRIVGISNQEFIGVTVATQAVCDTFVPVPHLDNPGLVRRAATTVVQQRPDLLIVGGWSRGYGDLMSEISRAGRRFPVIAVSHGTVFHGRAFGDDIYWPQIDAAYSAGLIDILGFAQPHQASYAIEVQRRKAAWIPHSFDVRDRIAPPSRVFRIGVLGGAGSPLKNIEGAVLVAKDFAANHGSEVEVVVSTHYSKRRQEFLETLSRVHLLVHMSLLECYPNLLQEAWSMGIPTIQGGASDGLTDSPLLSPSDTGFLQESELHSSCDALSLYSTIGWVRREWEHRSVTTHEIYRRLSESTTAYLSSIFAAVVADKKTESYSRRFYLTPLLTR